MKKMFFVALVATLAFSACSKEETKSTPVATAKYVNVTIPTVETRVSHDCGSYLTHWVAGDKITVYLYDGNNTYAREFTADKTGPTTTFSGSIPVGTYQVVSAHYPHACGATYDPVNDTFVNNWGDTYCTAALPSYDFLYSNCHSGSFDVTEETTTLPLAFNFKPLMARLTVNLGLADNETPKWVTFETGNAVMPTKGQIVEGVFSVMEKTDKITVCTNDKNFTIGMLPFSETTKMTVKVTTTDGLTYSDKEIATLPGLYSNKYYTLNVPCLTKSTTIVISDDMDAVYGDNTWNTHGQHDFFAVDPAYDPDGIFTDWYFYRAELKSANNTSSSDKLRGQSRIQLQIPLGLNSHFNYSGAFCTPPVQCEGTKTATVTYTAATNRGVGSGYITCGAMNDVVPMDQVPLQNKGNIIGGSEESFGKSATSITHTFPISNGQRIMFKATCSGGSYHVELVDLTIKIE